jgi:hypothetical protein
MTVVEDDHLTSGWEPDVPASDSIVRATLLAWADRMRQQAASTGATLVDGDGFVQHETGVGNAFFNSTLLLRPPASVDEIGTAIRGHDGPFVLWSAWPTPDLRPLGLELMGHPPFMVRPAGGGSRAVPDRLEIAEVTTTAELAEFETTLIEGYPLTGRRPGPGQFFGPGILGSATRFWLGRCDDRTVAVAGSHAAHGVVIVEWVACRTEARGRGFGAAVTAAAALVAPSLPAVLLASDDGRRVYESLRFLPITRFSAWYRL